MKIFVMAGEASGDALGAALMSGMAELEVDATWHGIAGPRMQAAGATSIFPMEELSVMGLAEILPKYPALRRRLSQTVAAAEAFAPDICIGIDSPDFTLRAARKIAARTPARMIHYVAPSVWAWRPGRAAKMARYIDHVLALLPFEPPYMEAHGMTCDFVGHPVTTDPVASPDDARAFRKRHDLGDAPSLLVLPGSRGSEVGPLLPIFEDTIRRLTTTHPDLRVILPTAPGVADRVTEAARNWPGAPVILDGRETSDADKRAAFAAADVALAASGTVSLELAAAGTPMVIGYAPARLTWEIMKRLVRVDTVTLVNLVSESRTVPEHLGPDCTPEALAASVTGLLADSAPRRAQIAAMDLTMDRLGRGKERPGIRAAASVLRAANG